jgi:hypothetical protein
VVARLSANITSKSTSARNAVGSLYVITSYKRADVSLVLRRAGNPPAYVSMVEKSGEVAPSVSKVTIIVISGGSVS